MATFCREEEGEEDARYNYLCNVGTLACLWGGGLRVDQEAQNSEGAEFRCLHIRVLL